jgi:alpha-D-ribose 1-methylphosphonate 5-triphosphate synthase subunit PhnH
MLADERLTLTVLRFLRAASLSEEKEISNFDLVDRTPILQRLSIFLKEALEAMDRNEGLIVSTSKLSLDRKRFCKSW